MTHPDPAPVEVLKPCPCCASSDLVPPPAHWPDGVVYCRTCGLRANSPAAWNTRPETHSSHLAGGGEKPLIGHRADMWCVGCMEDGPFARIIPAMPGGKFGTESFGSAETVHDALRLALETANLFRPKDFVSEINPLSILAREGEAGS